MLSNIEVKTGKKSVSLRGGAIFMWGSPLERTPMFKKSRPRGVMKGSCREQPRGGLELKWGMDGVHKERRFAKKQVQRLK